MPWHLRVLGGLHAAEEGLEAGRRSHESKASHSALTCTISRWNLVQAKLGEVMMRLELAEDLIEMKRT